ncbi:hypothetical protein WMY93_003352 [Mugilogobius chulae]|uniref:L1 transposable element RRM domain-containing protein n=1 Tax=Mugilogobius chulae TaxID=88201 RepID=A0AAW0QBE9_9GOBI
MSKTRLGKEQAAKASDSAEDRSAPPTDISEIMKAIASSEKTILERIDSSTKDLNDKIDTIKEDLEKHETRLDSVEFEGRQRRCNARIVGVKEGFENTGKTTDVVATMLKEMLGLNFTPTLDRAHRSLGQPGNSPRAIVVKFHYFQEKEDMFRRATSSQPLFLQDMKISIFHDFTAIVAKKRAAFSEAKRLLRDVTASSLGSCFQLSFASLHQRDKTSDSRIHRQLWTTLKRTYYDLKRHICAKRNV